MIEHNYNQYKTLEEKAEWFAYYHHGVTLHMYGDQSYFEGHLAKVVGVAKRFIHLIEPEHRDEVLAACWAHDTIEDCRVTYNDVKKVLGEEVAELVYALTNEKGKSRKHRANAKYYAGIRNTPRATFVKLCDRIANIEASIQSGSSMLKKYEQEQPHFYDSLKSFEEYEEMWALIDGLIAEFA